MNGYRFLASRMAFGLAAMAMSTLTVGALVVLPERLESQQKSSTLLIATRSLEGARAMEHVDSRGAESN